MRGEKEKRNLRTLEVPEGDLEGLASGMLYESCRGLVDDSHGSRRGTVEEGSGIRFGVVLLDIYCNYRCV